jgi:zinc transport system substrate-binding protein
VVSILPQAYFVERVGGEHVTTEVLVQPGHSPATYEPTPKQMVALAESQIFFRIGVPFENVLIPKIQANAPTLKVVDTRQGITLLGRDPHIWLDPTLVAVQAGTIAEALAGLDPNRQAVYRQNLMAFQADLERLDSRIAAALAPVRGQEFFVFHPAYGYFAKRYGLTQVPIEVEGKEPSARQLAEVIERAKRQNVRVIFVQPQFSVQSAEAVAKAIGGAVVALDPLPRNYLAELDGLARKIQEGLARPRP